MLFGDSVIQSFFIIFIYIYIVNNDDLSFCRQACDVLLSIVINQVFREGLEPEFIYFL